VEPVPPPVRIGEADRVDADRIDAVIEPMRSWVATVDDLGALDRYPAGTAAVAAELVRAGAGALAAGRALTMLNDALTVRLIQLAEAELGAPPCRYTWLALGSGGRMEQALLTDQDNAIAYAGSEPAGSEPAGSEPAESGPPAEDYFAALGAYVVDGLARAGLRRCPGGYMADRWRLRPAAWRELFDGWIDDPEPQALVEAEVFLDFRPIHGQLSTASLELALLRGSRVARFQVGMARAAVRLSPPRWLPLHRLAGRMRGQPYGVDLKRAGLAPVVLLARLYSLIAGSRTRSTLERLAAAEAAGTLSHDGADALAQAYRFLSDLRLNTQLRQVAAGAEPTNRARLSDLTADQRTQLRRAMRTVRDMQRATALRFHTHTVM
jgi:CBS domain-containing protein